MTERTNINKLEQTNYIQPSSMGHEISLLDVCWVIVQHKLLITIIIVFCTTLAIVFALLLHPVYQVHLIMRPPLLNSVESFRIQSFNSLIQSKEKNFKDEFFMVEPQDLYSEMINNVSSYHLQYRFFKEKKLADYLRNKNDNRTELDLFEQEFFNKITINGLEKGKEDIGRVTVTMEGKNSLQLAKWLNAYVQMADKEAIASEIKSLTAKINGVKRDLQARIKSLRKIEEIRRLDEIARLKEALKIAEKIDLVREDDKLVEKYQKVDMNEEQMSFSLQQLPAYLRGTKALKAEINILKKRKEFDPFISNIRNLQEEHNYYSLVKLNIDNVQSMRLDREAVEDERPIKPKKMQIIFLGFVVGILISTIVVSIRNITQKATNTRFK